MKRFSFLLTLLLVVSMAFASSNGSVRHLQPKRVPVILANYSDITFKSTDFSEYIVSLEKYWAENSFGQYTPSFDVIGPVNLPNTQKHYGENDYYDNDLRADEMVAQACNLAEGLADFTVYDQDGDGKLDAVVVIYAGEGEEYGVRNYDAVWAYTANLEESEELEYYVEIDGKTVTYFSAVPELQSANKRDGIGTLIHEYAHILGLPNFCTTDGGTQKTLGDWDVMDHGSYNNTSHTPAHLSAYECFYLGWVEPILLDGPMNVRLRDFASTGDCAIITATGQSNLSGISPDPREFYIVENRQQDGWDKYIPGHGMMLTKIDYVKNKWESDEVNNVERHPCVDLIEADGSAPEYKADIPGNGFFGKQGDLFPAGATAKNMFSNKMYFENVKEQDGVISFDFNGGVDKCTVYFSVSNGTCSTASLTESKKGAGVILPNVTANGGYTFKGWSTRKNSTVADAGQPGERYYPMCDGSVFAVMQDNTRYWFYYDFKGVVIDDYIGFNGAYVKTNNITDATIRFVKKEGYQTPTADNCLVRVSCGEKQLNDVVRYDADSIFVAIPAASITGDIYISIVNIREQKEDGCDSYSYTFQSVVRSGTAQDFGVYTWDVTIANENHVEYDKNRGAVFGSGSYPAGLVRFYTEETFGCGVAVVRVEASANGDGVLNVYVAGNKAGETEYLTTSSEVYEFDVENPQSGAVEIRLENTNKAMYLKTIEIDFVKIPDPVDPGEGIEELFIETQARKMLINGQIYIYHNDKIYNIMGVRIH